MPTPPDAITGTGTASVTASGDDAAVALTIDASADTGNAGALTLANAGAKAGDITVTGLENNLTVAPGFQGTGDLSVTTADANLTIFLRSVRLLGDAATSFTDNLLNGLEPRRDTIARGVENSLMLVTALAPEIGYDRAAAIAKAAHTSGSTLREAALAAGVSAADFDRLVRPEDMVGRGN